MTLRLHMWLPGEAGQCRVGGHCIQIHHMCTDLNFYIQTLADVTFHSTYDVINLEWAKLQYVISFSIKLNLGKVGLLGKGLDCCNSVILRRLYSFKRVNHPSTVIIIKLLSDGAFCRARAACYWFSTNIWVQMCGKELIFKKLHFITIFVVVCLNFKQVLTKKKDDYNFI